MAERYTGNGYKIWLNEQESKERIVDEDIWVGNTPGDGKSKATSGHTKSDGEWSYVLFDTWDDVLEAVGVEPFLNIRVSKSSGISDCGETITVTIESNTDWSLASNKTWAVLGTTSGYGNSNVTLVVNKNTGTSDRTATITASYGKTKTKTIDITQSKAGTLSISASTTSIESSRTTVTIAITSNTGWTLSVTSGAEYVESLDTTGGTGNKSNIKLIIKENPDVSGTRSVVLTATYGGNKTKTVTITQGSQTPFLNLTTDTTSVGNERSTVRVRIESNTSWILASNVSWATLDVTSGSGSNDNITLTIEENTGPQRQLTLVARYNEQEETIMIHQSAIVATLEFTAVNPILLASDTSITYNVKSNVNTTVVFSGQERHHGPTPSTTGGFTVPVNDTYDAKTYTVEAYCTDFPSVRQTITFTQKGKASVVPRFTKTEFTYVSYYPEIIEINFLGEPKVFNIYAGDYSWRITNVPSWVHLNSTSGTGDASITVSADTLNNFFDTGRTDTMKLIKTCGSDSNASTQEHIITINQINDAGTIGVVGFSIRSNVPETSYITLNWGTESYSGERSYFENTRIIENRQGGQVRVRLYLNDSASTMFDIYVKMGSDSSIPAGLTAEIEYNGYSTTSPISIMNGNEARISVKYAPGPNWTVGNPSVNISPEGITINITMS